MKPGKAVLSVTAANTSDFVITEVRCQQCCRDMPYGLIHYCESNPSLNERITWLFNHGSGLREDYENIIRDCQSEIARLESVERLCKTYLDIEVDLGKMIQERDTLQSRLDAVEKLLENADIALGAWGYPRMGMETDAHVTLRSAIAAYFKEKL